MRNANIINMQNPDGPMKRSIKLFINWIFPYSLVLRIRFELKILFARILNSLNPLYFLRTRKLSSQKSAKIHLGSGPNYLDGWINIDGLSSHKSDLTVDLRRRIPLRDNLAKFIYCEHFVEHLEYPDGAISFLKECHRLLENKGTLRISVPDAGLYLHSYSSNDIAFFKRERPECDLHMTAINDVFRQGGQHQWAYDFESMKLLMEKAGFANISQYTFGNSSIQDFSQDSPKRSGESLYVECVKPVTP